MSRLEELEQQLVITAAVRDSVYDKLCRGLARTYQYLRLYNRVEEIIALINKEREKQ